MARIRTVKPGFFKHSALFDAERETGLPLRLGYAGLWVCCDREGRFKWRPRELKLDALPFDDCDFSRVLDALESRGFLVKYENAGEVFGYIPTWRKHQFINNREAASELPEPPLIQSIDASSTREIRDDHAILTRLEGKGKEGDIGKEGEARERATEPPPDPDSFPEGLSELQYAAGILEHCAIVDTFRLRDATAKAIVLLAGINGTPKHLAAEVLEKRITAAQTRGAVINAFWFEDSKWKVTNNSDWQEFVAEGGTRDDQD
jgi:hypothetical protein